MKHRVLLSLLTVLSIVMLCMSVNASLPPNPYVYKDQWGIYGLGDGDFKDPTGIGIVSNGTKAEVFIADYTNARIQKFTKDGTFVLDWTDWIDKPTDIAGYRSGTKTYVYVADYRYHRIIEFDGNGAVIREWGGNGSMDDYGTGNGEFDNPSDIAVDADGNVYVVDRDNNRIQKFNSEGVFLRKWGSRGTANGQFKLPNGIAVHEGKVYVADQNNNRIQVFTTNGVFVRKWNVTYPAGVAIESWSDRVLVTEYVNNRIKVFNSDGTYVDQFGVSGDGNGEFNHPADIAIGPGRILYVVDKGNNRIQRFDWCKPVPQITELDPNNILAGSATFTLRVMGNDFFKDSYVSWNDGSSHRLTTVARGSNYIDARVPMTYVANPITVKVRVFTPAPGGGKSNSLLFQVHS